MDGADNNDDVVGGAVQNISQDAVQEFQVATNRFDARTGRTGSAVVNIVTKGGTNELHGSASAFFRDRRLQGLPATFDRAGGEEPPFDRQQYAFTLGGPIRRDRAWFFGAFEYRNQDGAVLVGERDTARRAITNGFADAPLDDLLDERARRLASHGATTTSRCATRSSAKSPSPRARSSAPSARPRSGSRATTARTRCSPTTRASSRPPC